MLASSDGLDAAVPGIASALPGRIEGHAAWYGVADVLKQAEFHRRGPAGLQNKVDFLLADRGTQGSAACFGRQNSSAGGHGVGRGRGWEPPTPHDARGSIV